jgi:hypothetical protein
MRDGDFFVKIVGKMEEFVKGVQAIWKKMREYSKFSQHCRENLIFDFN